MGTYRVHFRAQETLHLSCEHCGLLHSGATCVLRRMALMGFEWYLNKAAYVQRHGVVLKTYVLFGIRIETPERLFVPFQGLIRHVLVGLQARVTLVKPLFSIDFVHLCIDLYQFRRSCPALVQKCSVNAHFLR